jgi:hypothetical protein
MTTDRLLQDAVRDGTTRGSLADRLDDLFAFLFDGLVYAQIWEDPVLDMAAMELGPGQRVVTIASGGCNAMSYLLADPDQVVAFDLNRAHVALTRLKQTAAEHVAGYDDFFRLFGDAADTDNVARYDEQLRPGSIPPAGSIGNGAISAEPGAATRSRATSTARGCWAGSSRHCMPSCGCTARTRRGCCRRRRSPISAASSTRRWRRY